MGLDIRFPIGYMFSLLGALLTVSGLINSDASILKRSLGHNVNLYWGLFLIVFGAAMLVLAFRAKKNDSTK